MPTKEQELLPFEELPRVLARAKAERWSHLALLVAAEWGSPLRDELIAKGWPADRVFLLAQELHTVPKGLSALTSLTSLDLWGNQIGDEGARALSALTSLTSLDLTSNQIGAEGARALSALTSLTSLELADNEIRDEGARALSALTSLTSLNLPYNQIGAEGARALSALTSLTSLNLASNQIGDEGARALSALTSLTSLNLPYNQIGAEGARALSALTSLTSLTLWNNQIGDEGARALSALTSLTSLALWNNQIGDEGARALSALTSLTSLNLASNQIGDEGARALSALTSLTSLNLASNQIGDEGARALSALTSLTSLDLASNQIGAEGVAFVLNTWLASPWPNRLAQLDLRNNRDLSSLFPAEVMESRNAQLILAAYQSYQDARKAHALKPLNEAKLLVVGNEAVGKTSLIRYLVYNQPRDPNEPKTPGALIHEKIETGAWSPSGTPIKLNVWDFGGQEIMHGTHRFFLTARSIYLVVLEARREDDRSVYDWLKTIRNLGGDSPVIIVINKCEPPRDLRLDETQLIKDFSNIVAFVRTSCEPDPKAAVSIEKLRAVICDTLTNDPRLKHVRDPIPQTWLRVKSALADRARQDRVLDVRDFERLCEWGGNGAHEGDESITNSDERRALLGLLHDLGIVVAHGLRRDAHAAQREVTLLDPNWLTTAIYTLLNSKLVLNQGGEFGRSQLDTLLDSRDYPPERHEYIIDMMKDEGVGLCFELADSKGERFLLPEALPTSGPDYEDIWAEDSLQFRYDYDLLPRGLIPRFIVQAHRNLTRNPTKWVSGVVLEAAGCKILVRGDREKRQVFINVSGPPNMRRSALNVVLDDLDEVHVRNPEINPKAMVPLTDEPHLAEPYEHLRRLEESNGRDFKYLPRDASREYTVGELLDGVRREPRKIRGDMMDESRDRVPQSRKQKPLVTQRPRKNPQGPPQPRIAGPIGGVLMLIFGFLMLAIGLAFVKRLTDSVILTVAIGAIGVLVIALAFAFIAAITGIFRGTQLERILLEVLKKVPGLSTFVRDQAGKQPPDDR